MSSFVSILEKGKHTRTTVRNKRLSLIRQPFGDTFVGNTGYWSHKQQTWPVEGDKVTINNTDGGNHYVQMAYNIFQDENTIKPVTFRVKAKGENISVSGRPSSFGVRLSVTYTDEGLSGGESDTVEVPFPIGTWDDRQFSVTFNPSKPVRYCYCYVFARDYTGKVTFWDGELFDDNKVSEMETSQFGTWESDPIDIFRILNKNISVENDLQLETFVFEYDEMDDAEGLSSVEHSIEMYNEYDNIITESMLDYSSSRRSGEVITELINRNKKLWGYTYMGSSSSREELTWTEQTTYVDDYAVRGYHGVFIDMAGWDYGNTREEFNNLVDYIHSTGMFAIANAWHPKQVLLNEYDATYNPDQLPTSLGAGDWVLLESFYSRHGGTYIDTRYDYNNMLEQIQKYFDSVDQAEPIGVKVFTLAFRHDNIPWKVEEEDNVLSYLFSLIVGAHGWSYGGTSEGQRLRIPKINIGTIDTSIKGKQVDTNLWERETSEGAFWVELNGGIHRVGSYLTENTNTDTQFNNHARRTLSTFYNVDKLIDEPMSIVEYWESDDRVNWSKVNKHSIKKRYAKISCEMRR